MNINERLGLGGRLTIVASDTAGRVVEERRVDNLITLAGRTCLAGMFGGGVLQAPALYMAVGLGYRPAAESDTELEQEVLTETATASEPRVISDGGVHRVVATVSASIKADANADDQVLREGGIVLDWKDTRVLYNRVVFPALTRTRSLDLTLSWEVMF